MDQFVIDLTDLEIPNPQIGGELVLVDFQGNETLAAEDVANLAGTIAIELLTGLGKRMPIKYINESFRFPCKSVKWNRALFVRQDSMPQMGRVPSYQ